MSLLPELKRIVEENGFWQNKRLGQCFLVDERVLEKEAEAADVSGKVVLEIGPGFGFLTRKLLDAGAKKVVAVEKDTRLIPLLEDEFSDVREKVEFVNADFLELEDGFTDEKKIEVVVSNVPYAISSPLLFKLARMKRRCLLCLQKEFVERMISKPSGKEYSRLSVTSQSAFAVKKIANVPRTAFSPQPKVDSAIVSLEPSGVQMPEVLEKLILLLFQHKRKTLRAALLDSAEALGLSKEEAAKVAEGSGISARRIFTLSKEEIASLLGGEASGRRFVRKREDFVCSNCGYSVKGSGYTNHCPKCLWSMHVDVFPGDRKADCGGQMEPVGTELRRGTRYVLHKCKKCGYEKINACAPDDDFDAFLKLVPRRQKH